jgi:protein-S-isoprenylcysteine O-methyltransferase Ste14
VTSVPSLGRHGEGWVALQFACFGLIAAAWWLAPPAPAGQAGLVLLVAGAGTAVAGLLLAGFGLLALGRARALTAVPHPRSDAILVVIGPYRIARHPIYGGLILGSLGVALVAWWPASFLAAGLLAVILDLKRRREEVWLAERYPDYEAYRGRTKALLPFLY